MITETSVETVNMTALFNKAKLGTHHSAEDPNPLLLDEVFTHRAIFRVLGFTVEIESNTVEILDVAREGWGASLTGTDRPAIKIRLGLKQSGATVCPPAPSVRTHHHLLSMIADAENFLICELRQSSAFGWVSNAALRNPLYIRYHFLEAAAMCLLSTSKVTPIHAACVSFSGRGFLLCGRSGIGKTTLAYACAKAGWTYTSDDASYLLWYAGKGRVVRGNAHQVRFRPSAAQLFPEIRGRELTLRAEGKPSIQIPTAQSAGIKTSTDAQVHYILLLDRHESGCTELTPIAPEAVIPLFESSLYPFEEIWQTQVDTVQQLLVAKTYSLRYSGLTEAIQCLEQLTQADLL